MLDHVASANGFTPFVTLQPQYSLLVREIESKIVPACVDAKAGLRTVVAAGVRLAHRQVPARRGPHGSHAPR